MSDNDKCPTCGIAREHDGRRYYEALKQAGKPMCSDPFHGPEPVPMGELLARGGIEGPQGLDALADDEWIGDDADEAYIAALFDDSRALVANRRLREVERERDRWREEAWRCYLESGADPDGGDSRHLNPGDAVHAVIELRADYDTACDEADQARSQLTTLREAVEEIANGEHHPPERRCAACIAKRALASLDEKEGE